MLKPYGKVNSKDHPMEHLLHHHCRRHPIILLTFLGVPCTEDVPPSELNIELLSSATSKRAILGLVEGNEVGNCKGGGLEALMESMKEFGGRYVFLNVCLFGILEMCVAF